MSSPHNAEKLYYTPPDLPTDENSPKLDNVSNISKSIACSLKSPIKGSTETLLDLPIDDIYEFPSSDDGISPKRVLKEENNVHYQKLEGKKYTDLLNIGDISSESEIISSSVKSTIEGSIEMPFQDQIQFYEDEILVSPSPKMRKLSSSEKIQVSILA